MNTIPDAARAHDDAIQVRDAVLIDSACPRVHAGLVTYILVDITGFHTHRRIKSRSFWMLTMTRVVLRLTLRVHVYRVRLPHAGQLGERLEDEDDRDEHGEAFLCEAGDVPHEGAQVERDYDEEDQADPDSDPYPERQEVDAVVPGKQNKHHIIPSSSNRKYA